MSVVAQCANDVGNASPWSIWVATDVDHIGSVGRQSLACDRISSSDNCGQ